MNTSEQAYQPRYVNYARMHGKSPDDMIDFDNQRGGIGAWFTPWIQGRWAEFDRLTKNVHRIGAGHTESGHRVFDLWLDSSCHADPSSL